MPSSFFLLLRFFLRIDGVLIRMNDTRLYHEVASPRTSTLVDAGPLLVASSSENSKLNNALYFLAVIQTIKIGVSQSLLMAVAETSHLLS